MAGSFPAALTLIQAVAAKCCFESISQNFLRLRVLYSMSEMPPTLSTACRLRGYLFRSVGVRVPDHVAVWDSLCRCVNGSTICEPGQSPFPASLRRRESRTGDIEECVPRYRKASTQSSRKIHAGTPTKPRTSGCFGHASPHCVLCVRVASKAAPRSGKRH